MKNKSNILLLIIIFLLTGCTTEYTREDIIEYAKNELNLNDFRVSLTPKEIIGKDNYKDKVWTVKDKDNNLTFYIVDDYYYGNESVSNSLKSDYYSKLFLKDYKNITNIDNISFTNDKYYEIYDYIKLNCRFKNKNELNQCYLSLLKIKEYFNNDKMTISYNNIYDFKERNKTSHEVNNADSEGTLNNINENEYKKMLFNYYYYGISFQKENILNEMTKQDIEQTLNNAEVKKIYKLDNNNNIIKTYNELAAIKYGYGISYATLYKILKEEKYNVTGDMHHFKVTYNNTTYEISDNFLDRIYDNNELGYYYIKNGNKVKHQFYWYNFFKKNEIKEMFNLNLKY